MTIIVDVDRGDNEFPIEPKTRVIKLQLQGLRRPIDICYMEPAEFIQHFRKDMMGKELVSIPTYWTKHDGKIMLFPSCAHHYKIVITTEAK